jgi:hypothetical protein
MAQLPRILDSLIGMEEGIILRIINRGYMDTNSIHLLTGIPIPCIERKIDALINLELVKKTEKGYEIREDIERLLATLLGNPL